jgi:putative membrane protein
MSPDSDHTPGSTEGASLRDALAVRRTILANERTLLAYIRTGLAVFIVGVSFLHLLATSEAHLLGWAMIVIGLAVCVGGLLRFLHEKRHLDAGSMKNVR